MFELINEIVNLLNKIFSKEIIVFIISMFPVLELRGGLIAASLFNIPYSKALIICLIGNVLPVPFILLFLNKLLLLMEKYNFFKKISIWLKNKAIKNKTKVDKYGMLGLILFVGIPLPGTGAFTGSLVASVFRMDYKKSLISIFIGIIVASLIISFISYGIPYLIK